jgi:hypothetical protein
MQRMEDALTSSANSWWSRGATHLFEEPDTLEEVAKLARDWFIDHLSHAATNR